MKQADMLLLITALRLATILATPLPSENTMSSDFQLSPAPSNDLIAFSTNDQPPLQLDDNLLGPSSWNDGTPSPVGGQGTISSSLSQYPQEDNQPLAATPGPLALGNQAQATSRPTTSTIENLPSPVPTVTSDAANQYFCCSAEVFQPSFEGETCEKMSDVNTVVKKDGSTSTCEESVYNCPKDVRGVMKPCSFVQKDPPNVFDNLACKILGLC